MIKVEVGGGKDGPPQAEWFIHEKFLLANSGLATGCLAHDTTETTTGTIRMEEADPEAFGVFVNYLYKERLESAKMDIDQLIAAYILADYVACPQFADLVFHQLHHRTHNASFTYSAIQIDHVLSNTLAVQPLRTLLLDQVARGILQKKYDFTFEADKDDDQFPRNAELLGAVMQAIKATNVIVTPPNFVPSIYPDIKHYLKHDLASIGTDPTQPATTTSALASTPTIDAAEAEVGRHTLDYVASQSGASRNVSYTALKANGFKPLQAIRSLKR
jgi:hypothetical protein